jgi:hypothetical protein
MIQRNYKSFTEFLFSTTALHSVGMRSATVKPPENATPSREPEYPEVEFQ